MSKLVVIGAFALVSTSVLALQTTGTATGKVSFISDQNGLVPSEIHVGDTVVTTFGYGDITSTSSTPFDPQSVGYSFGGGGPAFQVSIGSFIWRVAAGAARVNIENDQPTRSRDQYYVESFAVTGAASSFPGALDNSRLWLGLYDWTAPYELVSSLHLPRSNSDINLSAVNMNNQGGIGSFSSTGAYKTWGINYSIDTFSISTVPEPSMLSLMLSAAALFLSVGITRTHLAIFRC